MDSHQAGSEILQQSKRHALHIPEITDLIVSHLTSIDILHCRGVCKEWRQLFSPFLKLHAIYWNHGAHNAKHKARFEERLETLGQFVQSLKQVYPIQSDLERIKRTCSNLQRIGFFLKDQSMFDAQALIKFFQAMTRLERVEVLSYHKRLMTTCLLCLASYQVSLGQEEGSKRSDWTEIPTTMDNTTVVESLKELKLGNSAQSRSFLCIDWDLLVPVLTRHWKLQDLTLYEAHLSEGEDPISSLENSWPSSFKLGPSINRRVQQGWGEILGRLAGREGRDQNQAPAPGASISASGFVLFNHLENLVLDNIKVSEELFVNILCRCPGLKTLTLRLTGVEIPMDTLSRCLPSCTQLSTITVNNDYGGLCIDTTKFWTFVPALRTCIIRQNQGPGVYFSELESNPSLYNSVTPLSLRPGSSLASLELSIDISIADDGIHYIMANCFLLERLVLKFRYFLDWEQQTGQPTPYPEWSCGLTLKLLEFQTIYRRRDQHVDERALLFMNRLGGLKVLEKFILPAKLLSDLSESENDKYSGFLDLLVRLDLKGCDYSRLQGTIATAQNTTLNSGIDITESIQKGSHELSEQNLRSFDQIWPRDGTGPVNFIPQMPSVKEVVLTSPMAYRFSLEVRYLHILMEALPGLKTIWTSMDLYGIDRIQRFKYVHSRFQEFYRHTGVELNISSHKDDYDQ